MLQESSARSYNKIEDTSLTEANNKLVQTEIMEYCSDKLTRYIVLNQNFLFPMADPELFDRRLSEVLCLIENRSVSNINYQ